MRQNAEPAPTSYAVINIDRGLTIAERVVVAGTSASRRRGLLGVDGLPNSGGIWIAPCEAIHTFGMKMPIDVVFLDRDMRIKKLVAALPPWRIAVSFASCSVLELESGAVDRSQTHVGDKLRFQPAH